MTTSDKSRADALTGPYSTRHRSIGDWMWCELMDYCKERGIPPADNDRLFAIVDLARAAWDHPVEQHEAATADVKSGTVDPEVVDALIRELPNASSAPLEGTGNRADERAAFGYAAPVELEHMEKGYRNSMVICRRNEGAYSVPIYRASEPARAPRTEVAGAVLSGDARECLMDVVSHHRDFVNACKVMHFDAINDDSDAYWEKRIDVLNRMKAQAERALSEPSADPAAAPADETCKCHRIGDWKGFHHPLCDRAHEDAPAAGAPPDERVAFETVQGAALFLASNHAVTHVPIEGVQRNRTWVAQRLLDLVETAKARAAASQPASDSHEWDDVGERCIKCGDKDWMADPVCRGATPVAAAGQKAANMPYLYVYEYDSHFGLHREFSPRKWNGMKPTRTVALYTAPPAQVATRPGLTENERSAIKQGLQLAESMGYPGVASILRALLEGAKHE